METLSFNYSELELIYKALGLYRVEVHDNTSLSVDYFDFLDSVIRKFEVFVS